MTRNGVPWLVEDELQLMDRKTASIIPWHLPMGVIFDLLHAHDGLWPTQPWSLALHIVEDRTALSAFILPNPSVAALKSLYMSSLKQADIIMFGPGKHRRVPKLSPVEQDALFDALVTVSNPKIAFTSVPADSKISAEAHWIDQLRPICHTFQRIQQRLVPYKTIRSTENLDIQQYLLLKNPSSSASFKFKDNIRSLPIKWFIISSSFSSLSANAELMSIFPSFECIQQSIAIKDLKSMDPTLVAVTIEHLVKIAFPHAIESRTCFKAITQGITLNQKTPLSWLLTNCVYADNFLYIILQFQNNTLLEM